MTTNSVYGILGLNFNTGSSNLFLPSKTSLTPSSELMKYGLLMQICYGIWLERNNHIFNGKITDVEAVFLQVIAAAEYAPDKEVFYSSQTPLLLKAFSNSYWAGLETRR